MPRLRSIVWTTLAAAACAMEAKPVEAMFAEPASDDAKAELDAVTQQAIAAARASVGDSGLAVAAAQRLFQSADLRLQRASVAWLDAHPGAKLRDVLATEDRLGDDVRGEILSLCTAGLEFADRAAAMDPRCVGARLHQGLHLSLIAWANGPARSLVAGHGSRLVAAIAAALAIDPEFDGGAPLRLQGRFRSKAPWPYGDVPTATAALTRAVAIGSVPVAHLFLGDAMVAAGDLPAARHQWQLAPQAAADESTRWSAELLRELARRRLVSM